jgi:S-adenosylmethionine:tRNA ribosyltransferase-isomerase
MTALLDQPAAGGPFDEAVDETAVCCPLDELHDDAGRGPLDVIHFNLPPELEAAEPAEARGLARDEVRLMVAWRHGRDLEHATFRDLGQYLEAGDLLVINTSGTLPAAVPATGPGGADLVMHLSTRLPAGLWVMELRRADGSQYRDGEAGLSIALAGGARADLLVPYGSPGRLWVAHLELPVPFDQWLGDHGRPIRYRHVPDDWPLSSYQTIFATEPGSAEMPSAARPFSARVVADLVKRGITIAPLLLHTGVSSQEASELPYPEQYRVPSATAELVNHIRSQGGRVIAVGTTVVRALETVTDRRGVVHPGEGWTEVVITPQRGVRAVDGLITGWHEPEATHLAMLEAVAGRPLLECSYGAALSAGYAWHEFGDSHLILP